MLVSLVTKPTKVVPRVLELVPPLAMGKIPETSEVKEARPLKSDPPLVLLTKPAEAKLESVVEPKVLTEKREQPVEEDMMRGILPPVPCKFKVAIGVVVLIPTLVPVS